MIPRIRLENGHKIYRVEEVEVHALKGVSIDIAHGEFVAIMGPSGSGKSTMMNVIGCLDQLTSGRYLLDGIDISQMSRDCRADTRNEKIGFVFQSFNLIPRTTVLENVELPMVYAGVPPIERKLRAQEALASVRLSEKEKALPNQLSGGQQQRVALARALVNNPAVILADEPTGALDTKTSEEVMNVFSELNAQRGITIVLVTHEPDIARYARRLVRFRDGVIQQDIRTSGRVQAATVSALDEEAVI